MGEVYNVIYSCGCIHQIENKNGLHQPTGKEYNCQEHGKKENLKRID